MTHSDDETPQGEPVTTSTTPHATTYDQLLDRDIADGITVRGEGVGA